MILRPMTQVPADRVSAHAHDFFFNIRWLSEDVCKYLHVIESREYLSIMCLTVYMKYVV